MGRLVVVGVGRYVEEVEVVLVIVKMCFSNLRRGRQGEGRAK